MIKRMIWFALGVMASVCLAGVVTVGPQSFLALSFFGSWAGINLLGIAAIAGCLAALPFGVGLRVSHISGVVPGAAALGVAMGAGICVFMGLLIQLPPLGGSSLWSAVAVAAFVASGGFLLGRYAAHRAAFHVTS